MECNQDFPPSLKRPVLKAYPSQGVMCQPLNPQIFPERLFWGSVGFPAVSLLPLHPPLAELGSLRQAGKEQQIGPNL